ncbi:patatin-like phospholipase family protein [Massilia sp. YIM B02763]|uniref:patatin-like phospholipase family protein n=1 Tax=Massilia sp. YIM B02763 TaxID=3050130 RepID=UPI0025B698EA|nr:patatin-like phospholipase family protein [Massilia sp. YIM B02763]MDN4055738.1 patatin-like phospholipase family protein [Massilia sp. YIM B02763]
MSDLTFHAGPRALERIRAHGLRAADIAVVPAAAGGPKGLLFRALDGWLFGTWFPTAPRERILIGSSIGAWRMAAACQRDPVRAFTRLGELYSGQRYTSTKPSQQQIDEVVQGLLKEFVRGHEDDIVGHPHYRLQVLAVRGKRALAAPGHRHAELRGFAAAALHNLFSRDKLALLMDRVVIGDRRADAPWLSDAFDRFDTHFAPLTQDNLAASLLASGTLPMLMQPVRDIPGAPPGHYWDGGIIDYNLALPYARIAEREPGAIVLYPHFSEHIVPGWLDKAMPWRRAARGPNRGWLDNVLVVAPSREFLGKLPRGKIIDRSDFQFYGLNHDARIQAWRRAMDEGERLRDAFAAFVEKPDVGLIRPL